MLFVEWLGDDGEVFEVPGGGGGVLCCGVMWCAVVCEVEVAMCFGCSVRVRSQWAKGMLCRLDIVVVLGCLDDGDNGVASHASLGWECGRVGGGWMDGRMEGVVG